MSLLLRSLWLYILLFCFLCNSPKYLNGIKSKTALARRRLLLRQSCKKLKWTGSISVECNPSWVRLTLGNNIAIRNCNYNKKARTFKLPNKWSCITVMASVQNVMFKYTSAVSRQYLNGLVAISEHHKIN